MPSGSGQPFLVMPQRAALSKWLGGIFLTAGLLFLVLCFALAVPAWESLQWPSVPGQIVGHRFHSVYRFKGSGAALAVRYRYEVEGQRYEGDVFSHASATITVPAASEEAALRDYLRDPAFRAYQRGMAVEVFHHPEDPSRAVLKRGIGWLHGLLAGAGVFFLALGVLQIRELKRSPSDANAPSGN